MKKEKVLEMKTYIVIGAGILGASTAYHLAKAGVRVTLVDRQDLGQATNAAAGIICPWLSLMYKNYWIRRIHLLKISSFTIFMMESL